MQSTSLAPLLSATFSLDSCCIILFRFFYDLYQSPTFVLAQRAGFHHLHDVADVAFVLLVMRHEGGSLFNELSILRVLYLALNAYYDGLIHLIFQHFANNLFTTSSFFH